MAVMTTVNDIALYTDDVPNLNTDTPSAYSLNSQNMDDYMGIMANNINSSFDEFNLAVGELNTEISDFNIFAGNKVTEITGLRDITEGYKNDAQTAKGLAETAKNEAETFRNEAETFRNETSTLKGQVDTIKVNLDSVYLDIQNNFNPQNISSLSDVDITGISNGQGLLWDSASSKFISGSTGAKNYTLDINESVKIVDNGVDVDVSILKAGNPFMVSTDGITWEMKDGYSGSITGDLYIGGLRLFGSREELIDLGNLSNSSLCVLNGNIYRTGGSSTTIYKYDGFTSTILQTANATAAYARIGTDGTHIYEMNRSTRIMQKWVNGDLTATPTTLDFSSIITGQPNIAFYNGDLYAIDSNEIAYKFNGVTTNLDTSIDISNISNFNYLNSLGFTANGDMYFGYAEIYVCNGFSNTLKETISMSDRQKEGNYVFNSLFYDSDSSTYYAIDFDYADKNSYSIVKLTGKSGAIVFK